MLLAEYRKNHPEPETDEGFPTLEDYGMFARVPYDDYEELYDAMLDILPSFRFVSAEIRKRSRLSLPPRLSPCLILHG